MSNHTRNSGIQRRRFLQGAALAGGIGLAGCAEDDPADDPDQELGERVPTLDIEYWSNLGLVSSSMEGSLPIIEENFEDLGIDLNIVPTEFATQAANAATDSRTYEIGFWYHTSVPDRSDPQEMTRRYSVDWAGADGNSNPSQYANCDYSVLAVGQQSAPTEEDRREMVNEAHSIMSEDMAHIPLFPTLGYGLIYEDQIEVEGVSDARGLGTANTPSMVQSRPIGDADAIITNVVVNVVEQTNFILSGDSSTHNIWSHLPFSTLTEYDENYDLVNMLAEDYEVEDDGATITAELRDAEFHNGDPVTSEDVQFTFQHMWENPEVYPHVQNPPGDEFTIELIDDRTVSFQFEQPYLPLITQSWPRWGIVHKDSWIEAGVEDDPEGVTLDPIIGSGPFQVSHFEYGEGMILEPFDGHPVHQPDPDTQIILEVYRDVTAAYNSFETGDLNWVSGISADDSRRADEDIDGIQIQTSLGFNPYILYPQFPVAPTKFREFRNAMGTALDRERMNQLVFHGDNEIDLFSGVLQETHPWRPPEDMLTQFTDNPNGDIEAAREVLADAGWGWDGDGNLHYPPDADLDPLWPDGETPSPDDFPCLEDL